MKTVKTTIIYLLLSISLLALTSCNKDPEGNAVITVDGKAAVLMSMNPQGDSKTVIVRGAQAWEAEATDWITFDPKSGKANQDIVVTISVGANTGEERLGSVTFTLPNAEFAMVSVVQPKADLK